MLGEVVIPDYGTVKADYLTQFYPVAEFDTNLVKPDMVDSVGVEIAFQYNSFFGDSLAPMQLTVYPLTSCCVKLVMCECQYIVISIRPSIMTLPTVGQ